MTGTGMDELLKALRDAAAYDEKAEPSLMAEGWRDGVVRQFEVPDKAVLALVRALLRGERERLPGKRTGYRQKIQIGGNSVYLNTGEYPDGRLGEIFLDTAKEGSAMRVWMSLFAIAISVGLQYGVPLSEFLDALKGTTCEPAGPVQGHDIITTATSMMDAVAQDLAHNYPDGLRRE